MRPPKQAPAIQPYWERFPSFFLYPISSEGLPATLGFVAGMTICTLLAQVLFIGYLLIIGLTLLFFRHAFSVLDLTARGHLGETLAHESSHLDNWIAVKHGIALLSAGALVLAVAMISAPLAMLLGLVLLLAWPANVMRLALSGSFSDSIHPGRLLETITAIGMPYLGLWACLSLLSAGSGSVQHWLGQLFGNGLLAALIDSFLSLYFLLVMFRLMGYVLYQYHDQLGLSVVETATASSKPQNEQELLLADCNHAIAQGKTDEALQILQQGLRQYPFDIDLLNAQLRLQLATAQATSAISETASLLLNLHLGNGKPGPALELIEQTLGSLPELAPKNGHDTLTLAKLAFNSRKFDLCTKLINGFAKRYPKHASLPEVMLLAARILCEHQRNDSQARKTLEQLIHHFPTHTTRPEAEKMLIMLDRLAPATNP